MLKTPQSTNDFGALEASLLVASVSVLYLLARGLRRSPLSALKGPSISHVLFGFTPLLSSTDGATFEEWASQYGPVFAIPSILGTKRVVLTDPKALANFFSKETTGYVQTAGSKLFRVKFIGKGLMTAEGDDHKRQRRALSPAFTNASIKNLTPVFFDSAYKAKAAWDTIIESNSGEEREGAIIEVQKWMNRISLDTIGLAGFSHDFGTLSGRKSTLAQVFESVDSEMSFVDKLLFLASMIVPAFSMVSTRRQTMLAHLRNKMQELGQAFLETTRTGDAAGAAADKSVIGLLVKSASAEKISEEEVAAQINTLLIAGYETTAISLTWALIELSRNPDIQTKLRNELLQLNRDPTWDELTNNLPLLDAVTSEILRLHPPVREIRRVATANDVLPLSAPLETASGAFVDTLFIPKGTVVIAPIQCMNRSESFWSKDAKTFNPSRWLDQSADQHRFKEIQGYRHLLSFSDGPRTCLGKIFALTEFKAVLSVLIRSFTFELPKGPGTVIGRHRNLLTRPKVDGEEGYAVPLHIRPYVPA